MKLAWTACKFIVFGVRKYKKKFKKGMACGYHTQVFKISPLLYFYRSKCLHDSHTILAIRIACHRRESAPIREFYKEQHKNLLSVDAEKSIWWVFNAAKTEVEKSVTHIQSYIQKTSISKWTHTMNKFYFCQNHDSSTSSCMLLHQPYDWRCNPDLVEQIINGRSFFSTEWKFHWYLM